MNFVYNDRAIDLMEECGIKREKISKVGNSLDTEHDWSIRKALKKTEVFTKHFGNDYPTIIFVGRVTSEKKLHMIIDAMHQLKTKGLNINLVVVGKDVDNVNLEAKAAEKGLSNNLFMYGPCYDDAILGELFYNSDLCVSPGNVGLTAVNSMSFGCPVISHDNFSFQGPEYSAIRPMITGDFFKQGDIQSLSDVIKKWISPEFISRRDAVRKNCYDEIDMNWTIYSETKAFKDAITKIFT